MKVLDLVLKGKWYDMIASGEKKEEYREIKPYWEKRLLNYKALVDYSKENYKELCIKQVFFHNRDAIEDVCSSFQRGYSHVRFHRGYTSTTITLECKGIILGKGNPEWGAPNEEVFIIKLGDRIEL